MAPDASPPRVVAMAASAGGIEALSRVVAGLPPRFGAAVLVVLHVAPAGTSVLPEILTRAGGLPAHHAEDGERLRAGVIYVAPPDHHLLVGAGTAIVIAGPLESQHRPAADPLFRSVAAGYGANGAGVVLSGALDDGTAGLGAIKRAGGLTIVQDPDEALFPGMPRSAIDHVQPACIASLADIPDVLRKFVEAPVVTFGGAPLSAAGLLQRPIAEGPSGG